MIPPIEISTLPGPAQKIVSNAAPEKLQLMAAKGIVPGLRPDAVLSVIVLLADSEREAVAAQAEQTLANLPDPLLNGALDTDLPEAVLARLSKTYVGRTDVLEKLVRMPRLPIEAVKHLAQHGPEHTVELVATNEERILTNPHLIELIYMNPHARMSTTSRLVELAVRHGISLDMPAWREIAAAIQGELIAEPTEEALPEDVLFREQEDLSKALSSESGSDAFFEDDEGAEQLEERFLPLYRRIADMSIAEKVRRATLGSREERLMLVREQNKLVATAAARSPMLQEPEAALISSNRGVVDDVLRIIARNPEFMRSYPIKRNLVCNPKTPIAISQSLITHMRESDLRKIGRSKNVSGAVRAAAKRHLNRRKT